MKGLTVAKVGVLIVLPLLTTLLFSASTSYAQTCLIPDSGPWPLCARRGNATNQPKSTPSDSTCIIPDSGPWPLCARQGNGTRQTNPAPITTNTTQSNCRYGMSITLRENNGRFAYLGISWLKTVRSGWYLDFGFQNQPTEQANYIRQIRVFQELKRPWAADDIYDPDNYLSTYSTFPDYERMANAARQNPGNIWIVGNEPDRFKFQDDMQPQIYARVYHDTYNVLKAADPTAQVAPAALVQVTPARLQYLDIVYNTYRELYGVPMPVDVWTAHVYPLAEKQVNGQFGPAGIALGTDPSLAILQSSPLPTPNSCNNPYDNVYCHAEHDNMTIFKDQVFAMRRWMKQHGYQNKPLIVTEVGILYPERFENGEPFRDELGNTYTRQRVNQFLTNTSAFLETAADQSLGYPQDNYKLVQQWAWFSMYTDGVTGSGSNLLKDGWETHGLGSESALNSTGFTFRREATNQPLVANLMLESLTSTPSTNGVRLTAMIRNNGNIAVENGYRVTFYADAALTKPIGSQTIQPILHGCATSVDTVSVNWIPPRTGWQGVWVKVDSAETVTETSERDNVKTIGVLWQ